MSAERTKEIIAYHERTKHGFQRLAPSLGYMDWANQPLPFRIYEGSGRSELPLDTDDPVSPQTELYTRSTSAWSYDIRSVAKFLELSMGLSAWKEMGGQRWSLRMNPSSGNLHPTECYLVLPETEGISGGLYHYDPFGHGLEQRATLEQSTLDSISKHYGCAGFLAGLSSVFWREAWKYGERAYRYCNHDAGHALACLSFSAALLGWKVHCITAPGESEISELLGLDRTDFPKYENERTELLCFVATDSTEKINADDIPQVLLENVGRAELSGTPNQLSREHHEWKIIETVADAARKERTEQKAEILSGRPLLEKSVSPLKAAQVIRRRRSVWEFSMEKSVTGRSQLLTILDRTLPRAGNAPFDSWPLTAQVNLLLFVHNVSGVAEGLYMLIRNDTQQEELAAACDPDFEWKRADETVPLYLLQEGNFRNQAMMLSCNQQIAGFGVFAVGMIARFAPVLEQRPWMYPWLFRECGMVGQVLYLESEAQGLRGTGIGCYFDDPVHELLGLKDNTWQSMYHFTAGVALEDQRLQSHAPYFHLNRG